MTGKGRILVVDDDPGVRTVFSIELASAGYSVATAETGRQAIEKSASETYDLALIDLRLPDMDGTRLFEAFEQNAPRMRKVMMTGDPNPPWNSIRASRNADAYLTKPVDLDVLLATVQEQLSKQRGED